MAAFDLDGTLTNGGSVFKWLRFINGNVDTFQATLWRIAPLAWGALRSGEAADRAKESLFTSLLIGKETTKVAEQSQQFADRHLARHTRKEYVNRLNWHLEQGHHVIIVSASPEIYVSVVARRLGAHAAVGTRLAQDPLGRLTGGYLGQNCRGEEKLRRLNGWIDTLGLTEKPEIYAYGNSRGDRRMLAASNHPVDAGKLGRFGALRAYDRLSKP